MEDYTSELEERLTKKSHGDRKVDDIALNMESSVHNMEPMNKPLSGELNNFSDCRMAVMVMCTSVSVSDCSLVEMIRKSASLAVGEVFAMEEARNSIIVAVGPNTPRSTGSTLVVQLLAITERVINEVRAELKLGNQNVRCYSILCI